MYVLPNLCEMVSQQQSVNNPLNKKAMETIKLVIDGVENEMNAKEIQNTIEDLEQTIKFLRDDSKKYMKWYNDEHARAMKAAEALKVLADVSIQISKPFTDNLPNI